MVRESGAHGLPLSPALDAASVSVALSQRRHASLLGREDTRRIRQRGEPHLVGNGYARIGEGSRQHQRPYRVRRGRSLDHGRATRRSRAGIAQQKKPFTKENLEATYVKRRRASWVERKARVAENSRDGFHQGVVSGLIGMALAVTNGATPLGGEPRSRGNASVLENYYTDASRAGKSQKLRKECVAKGVQLSRRTDGSGAAGRPFRSTANCSYRTRTRC